MRWNDLTDLEKDDIIRHNQWTLHDDHIVDNNQKYYLDDPEKETPSDEGRALKD